jgi:hypothetical protein
MRIAVTALSLTACVLVIALWVRSCWKLDLVFRVSSSGRSSSLGSNDGAVYFIRMPPSFWQRFGGGIVEEVSVEVSQMQRTAGGIQVVK